MQKSFYILISFIIFLKSCVVFTPNTPESNNNTQPSNQQAKTASNNALNQIKNISAQYEVLTGEDSLQVWAKIDAERLYEEENINTFINEFKISYDLAKDYASYNLPDLMVNNQNVSLSKLNVLKKDKYVYVYFNMPKRETITGVLRVKIQDVKYNKLISEFLYVEFINSKVRQNYSFFDKSGQVPVFKRYFSKNDTLRLQSVYRKNTTFIVKHITQKFAPAKPPFAKINNNIRDLRKLTIKRTFQVKSNELLNFQESGLYVIQKDTTEYFALSIYVAENRFPKLANKKDLLEPLVYITTVEEIEELRNSRETKKTMDKFWLKIMSGDIQKAKRTIKEYYRRVKKANTFFTTYKEGWKTDMGMIYTIFGQPNTVRRSADREEWTYQRRNLANIRFNFIRKPSQFSDNHYILQRYAEYEQIWYEILETWRAGLIK